MSISEFSSALKNKAIREWFAKEAESSGSNVTSRSDSQESYMLANVNTLLNPTSNYRSAEQTAEKTSFLLTKDTVASLLTDLKGIPPESPEFKSLVDTTFAEFKKKNNGIAVNRRKITVGDDIPAVFFNAISFEGITRLINNILEIDPGVLAEKYQKGHVVGLNTELLNVTRNRIANINTAGSTGKAKFLQELDNVIEYYKRLDYDSANIQPAGDIAVYASVQKYIKKTGQTKYLVELQPSITNQRSADEVKATIGSIRRLFTPGNLTEKQLVKIIDKLRKSVTDKKFSEDLLNLKSSPTFIDMIGITIANTLKGKGIDQEYTHVDVKIASKKVPKPNLNQIRQLAKTEMAKVQKLKKTLEKKVPLRNLRGQFTSLASLQNIINSQLAQTIQKNMGTGDRRDVLNYRSGRFASSAHVDRMSQSREGMITAFYTYMKNPYATFSEGGAQGSPRSRDPKLLISKSIREIAAEQVSNRMRAVLV
ncbi:MAG: hypothetical protein ACKOXV_02225 [Bacteroidota bacterium]